MRKLYDTFVTMDKVIQALGCPLHQGYFIKSLMAGLLLQQFSL